MVLSKYHIEFEYRSNKNKPWRKMTDWAYGKNQASVIRTFKRTRLSPSSFRKVTAKKIK